ANASGGTTPYAFSWSFGDGSAKVAGGATNPNTQSHTYNTKGTFVVKVNVTDANAKLATATSSITITGTALTVTFTVAPTTGTVGTSVSFTAQAAGDTVPYSFSWSFGDGTANVAGGSTNPHTQSHTYTTKGTVTVTVAPTTGTVGTAVSFTAQATGGTPPITFSWSFGDGTPKVAGGTANPNTQSHTYNTKGTFTVKVNATDASSRLASASTSITITGTPLTLSFSTAPTTGTVGTSVSFTAQAAGDTAPYTFSWNFGDGTANVAGGTTNPNTQSHTYNNKGTFTVKVNVTDANGAKQTASSSITISP